MLANTYLSEVKSRIQILKKQIEIYAVNKPVEIIAVSKFQNLERIQIVKKAGIKHFGENRAQEIRDKSDFYKKENIKLSFIGRIQKNKIKYFIGIIDLIQSISDYEIAKYINDRYSKENMKIDILLQINISREQTKSGFLPEEINENYKKIKLLKSLNIKGLMTIATLTNDNDIIENEFISMKHIFEDMKRNDSEIKILSMGMSNDYLIALKNGSNMLRIGRYIFGET